MIHKWSDKAYIRSSNSTQNRRARCNSQHKDVSLHTLEHTYIVRYCVPLEQQQHQLSRDLLPTEAPESLHVDDHHSKSTDESLDVQWGMLAPVAGLAGVLTQECHDGVSGLSLLTSHVSQSQESDMTSAVCN